MIDFGVIFRWLFILGIVVGWLLFWLVPKLWHWLVLLVIA